MLLPIKHLLQRGSGPLILLLTLNVVVDQVVGQCLCPGSPNCGPDDESECCDGGNWNCYNEKFPQPFDRCQTNCEPLVVANPPCVCTDPDPCDANAGFESECCEDNRWNCYRQNSNDDRCRANCGGPTPPTPQVVLTVAPPTRPPTRAPTRAPSPLTAAPPTPSPTPSPPTPCVCTDPNPCGAGFLGECCEDNTWNCYNPKNRNPPDDRCLANCNPRPTPPILPPDPSLAPSAVEDWVYTQPAWWERIQASFTGPGRLKRCVRRQFPPTNGMPCARRPKTCFYGSQTCPSDGNTYPEEKCVCSGGTPLSPGTWNCLPESCPP